MMMMMKLKSKQKGKKIWGGWLNWILLCFDFIPGWQDQDDNDDDIMSYPMWQVWSFPSLSSTIISSVNCSSKSNPVTQLCSARYEKWSSARRGNVWIKVYILSCEVGQTMTDTSKKAEERRWATEFYYYIFVIVNIQ